MSAGKGKGTRANAMLLELAAASLLVLLLSARTALAEEHHHSYMEGPKPKPHSFDLEYGKHIVDLNTAVYCPNGQSVETWTCPVCNKPRIKDFKVDKVIHEFELNIMAFTGYSPSLGKTQGIQECYRMALYSENLHTFRWWTDAFIFAFRGTKSDDIRNWIIDLSVLELDLDLPYPNSEGAKVHG